MFWLPFSKRKRQCEDVISDSRIELQFDVEKPIDLIDLTLAFQAFHRQYSKFVAVHLEEKNVEIPSEDSVRLYVTKIESNCIFAELAWFDPQTLLSGAVVLMDNANTVCEFLKSLTVYLEFFKGKFDLPEGKQPGLRDSHDFKDLLEPIMSAGDGAFKYRCAKYKNGIKTIEAEVEHVSTEVVKAMNGIDARIALLEKKSSADHENVLLSLESVQDKMVKPEKKRTRDYGTIERISSKPLPIYWASEMDQQKVKSHPYPFKISIMVDVNVETKHGEPRAYRIVSLRDIIDD